MMIRATMSRLALLRECAWWAGPDAQWNEQTSEAASIGTLIHRLAEDYIDNRLDPETSPGGTRIQDENAAKAWGHLRAWIDEHRRAGWRTEVPFAYDVAADTARELPKGAHRDYSSRSETEICGTADLVYLLPVEGDEGEHIACVDDFKWSGFHGDAARAEAQLEGLALAVARAWGVDRVRARAIRVSESGVDDTTEVYWFDTFDFSYIHDVIEAGICDAASPADNPPTPGPHCTERFCPALASCPRTTTALAQVIPETALVRKDWRYTPAIESPDHLAWMLSLRPTLKRVLDQVDAAAADYVKGGAVGTSDGRVIEQKWRTMPRMNQGALMALAREKGATQEEIDACVRASLEPNGVRVGAAKRGGKAA